MVFPPEGQGNFHRHSGMVGLMLAGELQQSTIAAVINIVFQRAARELLQIGGIRHHQRGMRVGRGGQQRCV